MIHRRVFAIVSVVFSVNNVAFSQEASQDSFETRRPADWIPVGTVSPAIERRAIETRARIETRIPRMQRDALRGIREELDGDDRLELRIAAVPLVIELLALEYSILEFPTDYRVDSGTRLLALEVLAELGGTEARRQLRESVVSDVDETVRACAAQLLAFHSGADPETDLRVVSNALAAAVRKGASESEVTRLLEAARAFVPRVWNPEVPSLLEALVSIHQGAYSRSLRRNAFSFLEWLAER